MSPEPNPDLFPGQGIIVNAPTTTDAAKSPTLTALGEIKAVIASGLKAVGISDTSAKRIGDLTGNAIQGAAEGGAAGSLFASLTGSKSSSLGSSIGGAIGNIAGKSLGSAVSGLGSLFGDKALQSLGGALGPIGSVVGGILGGVIGGLFKKTPTGGATITNTNGDATLTGNSSTAESNADSLASSVQSGLSQIAQQLGGTAADFSGITIGTYGKYYRVNTEGTKLGGSSSPVAGLTSYDSSDEAISAAIQDAVARGAVQGLDTAVQEALGSSTDINKSLAEALQVEKVEALIGGIGYTLKQTFSTFDATAASNLAIAKKYNLDVVAEEQATADARTALVASTIKTAVGSLQDFITSETSGDDFEGSATDKRNAQLAQIAALQPKAQAGDQDSIDQLATLYQNLLDTSKDAFGTAGTQYTSDRTLATTGAQGIINAEVDRVNAAAGTSSDSAAAAATATTAAVNETNDLTAVTNSKLDTVTALLTTIAANSGSTASAAVNQRVSKL